MSRDEKLGVGHYVFMEKRQRMLTESEFCEQFRQRLRAIQGSRTDEAMAGLLGETITREAYNKWKTRGSRFPMYLLPKLRDIAGLRSVDELLDFGAPAASAPERTPQKRRKTG